MTATVTTYRTKSAIREAGKALGKDAAQGKQTALASATPDEALATARRKVESSVVALRDAGLADGRLEALCFFLVERDH